MHFKQATVFKKAGLLRAGLLLLWIGVSLVAGAQQADTSRNGAPRVFLDCNTNCDITYIRQEIAFVNYVRDRKEAELHLLITSQGNGGGGETYTLNFIGQQQFKGMDDTLSYNSRPDDTEETVREGMVRLIKVGLVRYIARTPLASKIEIAYTAETEPTAVEDKWNNWVFEVEVNGSVNAEESFNDMGLWAFIGADRVTPGWKVEMNAQMNYNESNFDVGGSTVTSISRNQGGWAQVVKSMGDHWSAGAQSWVNASVFSNLDWAAGGGPAIEYNIYPYEESTRRQLRFLYHLEYKYNDYLKPTIFDKSTESIWGERLSIALEITEKWGSVYASLTGYHAFHDFDVNRLNFWTWVSVRLFKGFSMRVHGNASLIHDQISLPKGSATEEEILLRQRQLATQFSYNMGIGLTYTFGSIYNNVVNPRFGD